jgi:enoyl-CoA hydratase
MIRTETQGRVRLLHLSRPEKRNAIDTAMAEGLIAALRGAEAEDGIAAIVLAADGPLFCAGADLGERKALAGDNAALSRRAGLSEALLQAPGQSGKPVIAAVQGAALGAGAALALCCDMMVMAEGASMSFPEAKHGMLPVLMAPVLRPRLLPATLFRLLATGAPLTAGEALSLGLAAKIMAPAALLAGAAALAESAATLPVPQLRALKRLCAAAPAPLVEAFATARAIAQEIA